MAIINGIDTELIMGMVPTGNSIGNQIADIAQQQSNNTNKPVTPIEDTTQQKTNETTSKTQEELTEEQKEALEIIKSTTGGNALGTATQIAIDKAKETLDKQEEEKQEQYEEKGENGKLAPKEQVTYDQQKLWEREDAIRKETQEREDNAYQRMVEDMRKAGINPNLINISGSGASSGGGITSATRKENIQGTILSNAMQEALKEIEMAFEKGENTKDRITNIFENLQKVVGNVLTITLLS